MEGTVVLGAVSASWGLSKDIFQFVKRVKTAGADIQDLDHKFNNDRLLLERYFRFFERHLKLFSQQENDHLKTASENIKANLAATEARIRRYARNGKSDKAIWAALGSSLIEAEGKLSSWVSGLQAWLVFVPDDVKRDLYDTAFLTRNTSVRLRELYAAQSLVTEASIDDRQSALSDQTAWNTPLINKKDILGSGSFSHVYKVEIDQDWARKLDSGTVRSHIGIL